MIRQDDVPRARGQRRPQRRHIVDPEGLDLQPSPPELSRQELSVIRGVFDQKYSQHSSSTMQSPFHQEWTAGGGWLSTSQ